MLVQFLVFSAALATGYALYNTAKFLVKGGFGAIIAFIKSPIKGIKAIRAHRKAKKAERKLINENKAYWVAGQEKDKIEALARYKADAEIRKNPNVRAFELERQAKSNKAALRAERKAAKSKATKRFNKITK